MMEMKGVPTVTFCTQPFRTLATVRRESLGLPDLQIVFLPHPMMTRTAAQVGELADQFLEEVVQKLTAQPDARRADAGTEAKP